MDYLDIRLDHLKVVKNQVWITYKDFVYKYEKPSKQLVQIITNNRKKHPRFRIGFEVNGFKVLKSENIEIIYRKLSELDPKAYKFLEKRDNQDRDRNNQNIDNLKVESIQVPRRKKKLKKTNQEVTKLTDKFRMVEIDKKYFRIKDKHIILQFQGKDYEEYIGDRKLPHGTSKKNVNKFKVRINKKIVKIDDRTKGLILYNLNSQKEEVREKRKKAKDKNTKKRNSVIDKPPISLEQNQFTDRIESNWDNITFFNGAIQYKNKRYKEDRSKNFFNYLKSFFDRICNS